MLEKQRGILSKKMKGSSMLWKARHLPVLTSLLSFRINQKNHSSLPVFSVKRNFVNLENKDLYWTKEWRGLKNPFLGMLCFRLSIKGARHLRNVLDEPSLWKKAQEAGTGGPNVILRFQSRLLPSQGPKPLCLVNSIKPALSGPPHAGRHLGQA